MTIIVSVLILAALLTVIGACVFVVADSVRRVSRPGRPLPRSTPLRPEADPPPFGALPTLGDAVGPLGNPAPGADLSSTAESERDIYGE